MLTSISKLILSAAAGAVVGAVGTLAVRWVRENRPYLM